MKSVACAMVVVLAACGDDGGRVGGGKLPEIEVREGQRTLSAGASLSVRPELPATVTVANTGTAVLRIDGLTIESTPAGAFVLVSEPMPSVAAPIEVAPDGTPHAFQVEYHPEVLAEGASARATVRIATNLTLNADVGFAFDVVGDDTKGKLTLSPATLDLGTVSEGATATKQASLLNTGSAPLVIERVVLSGHPGFTVVLGGETLGVTAESAAAGIVLDPPITIAAGASDAVDATYRPTGGETAEASLVFFTNVDRVAGTTLGLAANLHPPCIEANPRLVSFGAKAVGERAETALEVKACGTVPLVIDSVTMIDDGGGVFSVEPERIGTFPLTVPAGTSVYVPVVYFPSEHTGVGPDGQWEMQSGSLRIHSNAYVSDLDVAVEGFAPDSTCPIPHVVITEGAEVLPQTLLHLDGSGSLTPSGTITAYEWAVEQPEGSRSTFAPSRFTASPTFEVNVAGDYTFRLVVTNSFGEQSCAPAEAKVSVVPNDAIHVELLWHTPGDPDETDESEDPTASVGSDLDLHFLHPSALGTFDQRFDCYWDNPRPQWGTGAPADDPRLDRDDTDGAGPENLNLEAPENGKTYRVRVHAWSDWGFGPSFATVRVYLYGVLADEWGGVELDNRDLWESHTIEWPAATVTRVGSEPQITPNVSR